MSPLDRRLFVKTLLVAAAGASGPAATLAGTSLSTAQQDAAQKSEASSNDSPTINLEVGEQQLRVSPAGGPLHFQNFLREGAEWKPSSLAKMPLISGASFLLTSERVTQEDGTIRCHGNGTAAGRDRRPVRYEWDARVTPLKGAAP
jgi:hypothetical protein